MLIRKLQVIILSNTACGVFFYPITNFMTASDSSSFVSGLSEEDRKVIKSHQQALSAGLDFYEDPITRYLVFTQNYHLKRGKCCGSACRHVSFHSFKFFCKILKTY